MSNKNVRRSVLKWFVVVLALLFTINGALALTENVLYYQADDYSNVQNNQDWNIDQTYTGWNAINSSEFYAVPSSSNFNHAANFTIDTTDLNLSAGEYLNVTFDNLQTHNRFHIISLLNESNRGLAFERLTFTGTREYVALRNIDTGTPFVEGLAAGTGGSLGFTSLVGTKDTSYTNYELLLNGSHAKLTRAGTIVVDWVSLGKSLNNVAHIDIYGQTYESGSASIRNLKISEYVNIGNVSNFSVSVKDVWSNASVNNFSVSVNGTIYTTTTGTVTTNLLDNDTNLYDVTIFDAVNSQGGFFNRTYEDTNISSNLDGILSQTNISFLAYQKITDALIGSDYSQITADSTYDDTKGKIYSNFTVANNVLVEIKYQNQTTFDYEYTNYSISNYTCGLEPLQMVQSYAIGISPNNAIGCLGGNFQQSGTAYKIFTTNLFNVSLDSQTRNNRYIPITAGTYNVTFIGFDDYYNKTTEVTIPALSTSTYDMTGIYDALLSVYMNHSFDNSSITPSSGYVTLSDLDFNESFSGTTPNKIGLIQGYNYTITPNMQNYTSGSDYSNTIYINSTTEAITLYLYKFNSILFRFFNEVTNLLINDRTVTIDVIGDTYATNTSTTNGTLYLTLLDPNNYIFRYNAENYTQRSGYLALTNNTASQLNLYLLPEASASNITVEVIDQNGNPLEDVQVKASRYYITTNTYVLQETGTTNFEGKTMLSLQLNSEYYKFYVELNGELLRILPGESTSTTPSILTSTSITLRVLTADDLFDNEFAYLNYNGDVVYNEDTQNFRFDWSDSSSVSTNNCLYVYAVNVRSRTLYNSSCSTSTTGSILISITNDTYDYFVAEAYFTDTSDNDWLVDSAAHSFETPTDYFNQSGTGLILQILLSLLFVGFAAATEIRAVTIMLPVSLIVGKLIGFTLFGWPALLAFTTLGFIFLFVLTRNQ